MLAPLIFSLIALLLVVLIGYNIIQQYKLKLESEKRISISKQRAVISEVDELLLSTTKMPFSKSLLLILHIRIRNALLIMLKSSPSNTTIREHLKNTDEQIVQLQKNYTPPDESILRAPDNDKDALALLQITKKIRAVLRSEYAKGTITTDAFVAEEKRIELIQLKINLENSIKRIFDAQLKRQFGSANQMITKLLSVLAGIPEKDAYLEKKQTQLIEIQSEIKEHLIQVSDKELETIKAKEQEKQNDLDVLFQDKKKW